MELGKGCLSAFRSGFEQERLVGWRAMERESLKREQCGQTLCEYGELQGYGRIKKCSVSLGLRTEYRVMSGKTRWAATRM